jgi:hypothetical protein
VYWLARRYYVRVGTVIVRVSLTYLQVRNRMREREMRIMKQKQDGEKHANKDRKKRLLRTYETW